MPMSLFLERIKDEKRSGKVIRSALKAGFERAFTTIIDSEYYHLDRGGSIKLFWDRSGERSSPSL